MGLLTGRRHSELSMSPVFTEVCCGLGVGVAVVVLVGAGVGVRAVVYHDELFVFSENIISEGAKASLVINRF